MRALEALWLGALFSLLVPLGCRPYPPRPVVDEVVLEPVVDESKPHEEVDIDAILERLATVESPDLFGIFPRVLEYETYDPTVLGRDLERIERAFRARGYYEAKVIAARVVHLDDHHVRVEIRVHQGDPVRVENIPDTPGLAALPLEYSSTPVIQAIGLRQGDIFDESQFEADKAGIQRVLRSMGFAFAKVEGRATIDIAKHSARVIYQIDAGPPATYGPISIVGLKEIPEGPVRDALSLEEGRQFSSAELDDAEVALMSFGVFSKVEIREDLQHREGRVVPLTVVVEESKLRTIRLGGGMRLDVLRLGFRLRAAWENRNFLGGMRKLTIEAQPGVTLFPTAINNLTAPVALLPEFRLNTALRQPSFLEGRTTGFIEGRYAFFPVLYPLPEDADAELEPVLGYHQVSTSTGVERSFFLHQLFLQPSYNLQAHFPFYYQNTPTPDVLGDIGGVLVSFPELVARLGLDFKKVRFVVANRLQVAGYVFQGDVSDLRTEPELLTFVPLSDSRRGAELALRVGFGFLFPSGYGDLYDTSFDPYSSDPTENTPSNPPTDPDVIADQQKMLFRAFYSGGPTSNRGYPFRGVGPHGPVGFLLPSAASAVNCGNVNTDRWQQRCMRPLGGMTLWELSLEVRFPIAGDVGGVVFVDASDLRPYRLDSGQAGTIRFNVPHLSPGVGLRYATPVGPLRLDLAYRVPYAQEMFQRYLSPQDGSPTGRAEENLFNLYWLPLSLNFAIGEAFD